MDDARRGRKTGDDEANCGKRLGWETGKKALFGKWCCCGGCQNANVPILSSFCHNILALNGPFKPSKLPNYFVSFSSRIFFSSNKCALKIHFGFGQANNRYYNMSYGLNLLWHFMLHNGNHAYLCHWLWLCIIHLSWSIGVFPFSTSINQSDGG